MDFEIENGVLKKYNGAGGNVVIPSGVTSIGSYAFSGCKPLTRIIIPQSVKSIGSYAFGRCDLLTSITIPESVTSIGEGVFGACKNLIQTINGVKYIDKWVVGFDYKITSLFLRAGTIGIARMAFKNFISLRNIVICNGVKSICEKAFYNCSKLKDVTIPDSVTNIGKMAFETHSPLHITIGANISKFTAGVFGDGDSKSQNATVLTVTLLDGVTEIGNAFYNCKVLKEIKIPATVERVNARAFFGCENLTTLTIEEGVKYISEFAFAGCTSLKEIVFPDSMDAIEESAFFDCKNLKKVSIPWNCAFDKTSFPKGCKVKRRN